MENTGFERLTFGKRLKTMLRVDLCRMARSRLFYILLAVALVTPILITVMMTMMDGAESKDPQTGEITIMEGPENTWQSIGTLPTSDGEADAAMGGMDVMSMCNINMMFMAVAVFVCLFISDDFRSGFAKNLFTSRAGKGEYVISKTLMGFICGGLLLILYFIGAMLGGAVSGLSFDLHGLSLLNIIMCMGAKIFLMLVFVAIDVIFAVTAKSRAWLSLCLAIGGGMMLFMMIQAITPLTSTPVNLVLCIAGGILFSIGLGAGSCLILKKTSLV